MKTVIYHGEPVSLGRFGVVEDGAHLQVTEQEFAGIRDDERFELISRRKPAKDILPLGTPFFDLRFVLWDHPALENNLEKEGKTTLKNIAEAMNSLGADVSVTEHDNTPLIVDAIAAEAKALGWHKLDREARLALGTTAEEAPQEEGGGEGDEDDESDDDAESGSAGEGGADEDAGPSDDADAMEPGGDTGEGAEDGAESGLEGSDSPADAASDSPADAAADSAGADAPANAEPAPAKPAGRRRGPAANS